MLIQDLLQMISKEEVKEEKIIEGRGAEVGDALDKFIDDNNLYNFEGKSGINHFEMITRAIGYRDIQDFLADNSGCYEVMVEWIKSQRNDEWIEKLGEKNGAKENGRSCRKCSCPSRSLERSCQGKVS